ncbi:hypothetical protein G6F59_018004 [Rhizopus arrhizus]|nr:hypothetical protein G6F59_018004 [Rhizopus arrhizus]
MHKLFKLRSCEDSVFRNRSRPCLQYQIGRCSAPCVELVAPREYAESVRRAALFLEGKSDELTRELGEQMQHADPSLRGWPRRRPGRAGGGHAGLAGLCAAAGVP